MKNFLITCSFLILPALASARPSEVNESFYSETQRLLQAEYEPEVLSRRGDLLRFAEKWDDPDLKFNTYFNQTDENYPAFPEKLIVVYLSGGLSRQADFTRDAFLLAACHELGHVLGGYPYEHQFGSAIRSSEGAADYFAASKCFKKMIRAYPRYFVRNSPEGAQNIVKECEASGFKETDKLECERTILAGLELSRFSRIAQPRHEEQLEPPPSLDAQEKPARLLIDYHTSPQCRLDTYLAGALCNQPIELPFKLVTRRAQGIDWSNERDVSGSCAKELGFTRGIRPACWYQSVIR